MALNLLWVKLDFMYYILIERGPRKYKATPMGIYSTKLSNFLRSFGYFFISLFFKT
jgi:hypothetical protein